MAWALRRLTASAALVLTATAAGMGVGACDDSSGFDSGVPGNKLLEELDDDEAEAICEAAQRYRERSVPARNAARAACVREGDVSPGDSCERMLDECAAELLQDADEDEIEALRDDALEPIACFTVDDLSGCSATVTDFEQCYQVSLTYAGREVTQATCGDGAGQVRLAGQGSSALSCQRLRDDCPNVASLQGSGRPDEDEPDAGIDAGAVEPPEDSGTNLNPTCTDLEVVFDGSDCANADCDAVSCDCEPFARSLTTCNAIFGCVQSVDCDAFCAMSVSAAASCASATDCADDDDCGLNYCVRSSGASRGVCSRGAAGDRCFEAGDCDSVRCVQAEAGSGMVCGGDALLGQGCDRDSDCNSGICRFDFSVTSFNGTCSDGALGTVCADDGDCLSMTCTRGAQEESTCTDRALGTQCDGPADCDSGQCSFGGRAGGVCTAGQFGEVCDGDDDCDSNNCVTDSVSFLRSCGYAPGDACTTDGGGAGVADCEGSCQVTAPSCLAGGSCGFTPCGGGFTCATWDENQAGTGILFSPDYLIASASSSSVATVRATIGVASGKWYWEVTMTTAAMTADAIGVTSDSSSLLTIPGFTGPGVGFAQSGSLRASLGSVSADACGYGAGDVVSVALDADNGLVYFAVNGLWQAGGDPGAGTGGIPVGSATIFPSLTLSAGDVSTVNFGATMFSYEPPANFLPGLFL